MFRISIFNFVTQYSGIATFGSGSVKFVYYVGDTKEFVRVRYSVHMKTPDAVGTGVAAFELETFLLAADTV